MPNKFIVAVAGKSGGHIIPALTLAKEFIDNNADYKLLFFSTHNKLDQQILLNNKLVNKYFILKISNLSLNPIKLLIFILNFIISYFKALKYLYKFKPTKVISTGGLVSIPVCAAAKLLRIPIELYELNSIAGKATKLLSKLNIKVFTVFSGTCKLIYPNLNKISQTCLLTNYPVRFSNKDILSKQEALEKINLEISTHSTININKLKKFEADKKTIFIIGGSQGSISINSIIKKFFENLINTPDNIKTNNKNLYQVIHQTGTYQVKEIKEFYDKNNINNIVFDFKDNINIYYCAADIIISRAGAGSIFEILFFAKILKNKAIIIPLENAADDHQLYNALNIQQDYPDIFIVKRQNDISIKFLLD